jgi:5'-deoxynucleotidase YfbR-like HD superfamily hydrolase
VIIREQILGSTAMAGRVRRYHTWPVIHQQSVAEHSWRVATIHGEVFGPPLSATLLYMLLHDVGELSSGDVPFLAKDAVPGYREAARAAEAMGRCTLGVRLEELSEGEQVRVKACDLLEMWEFGLIERRMGNEFADPVIACTLRQLDKHLEAWPEWRQRAFKWVRDHRLNNDREGD